MFLLNGPRDEAPREVYLESNRAGRTLAHVPRLPGCVVRGEAPEEAAAAVPDALRQHLAWLAAHSGGISFEACDSAPRAWRPGELPRVQAAVAPCFPRT
jgi:predicted RNase H-like HicB family nuclease